jgi:hypothetical protein
MTTLTIMHLFAGGTSLAAMAGLLAYGQRLAPALFAVVACAWFFLAGVGIGRWI